MEDDLEGSIRGIPYSTEKVGRFTQDAYLVHYVLQSSDWFEEGGASSLHHDRKSAERYSPPQGYYFPTEMEMVWVTSEAKERLKQRPVFEPWEH